MRRPLAVIAPDPECLKPIPQIVQFLVHRGRNEESVQSPIQWLRERSPKNCRLRYHCSVHWGRGKAILRVYARFLAQPLRPCCPAFPRRSQASAGNTGTQGRTHSTVQRSECLRAFAAPTKRIPYSPTERRRNRRIRPAPQLVVAETRGSVHGPLPTAWHTGQFRTWSRTAAGSPVRHGTTRAACPRKGRTHTHTRQSMAAYNASSI